MYFKRSDKVKHDDLGEFMIIQQNELSFFNESLPRFDIENIETGDVIKGGYLYNGSWKIIK